MIQSSYISDTYLIRLQYIGKTEEINLTFYCQPINNNVFTAKSLANNSM